MKYSPNHPAVRSWEDWCECRTKPPTPMPCDKCGRQSAPERLHPVRLVIGGVALGSMLATAGYAGIPSIVASFAVFLWAMRPFLRKEV